MESKRYIAYERVSTEEQAASGLGLEAQRQALDRAFEYEGWELAERIRDEGQSASTLDRPGLRRALELIAAGGADGIAVAKLDRLTRSIVDFGELLEWLNEAGASLAALDFRLDTSTPTGAMVAQILIVVAEWERRTNAERTRNALAAKRARGEPVGRASVVDDPELAERIQALRGSGLSLHEIARRLSEEGVQTVRGGTRWRASSVQSALGYERPAARRKRSALPEIPRRRRAA
jgi:DNA invertase Pin-like site-specific DNA recombinase